MKKVEFESDNRQPCVNGNMKVWIYGPDGMEGPVLQGDLNAY